MELSRESLLHAILSWYADPEVWKRPSGPSPYSGGGPSRASADAGRAARAATSATTVGRLLTVLCDVRGIALTALGRRAGVPDSRIGEIARGSDPTVAEAARIAEALSWRP